MKYSKELKIGIVVIVCAGLLIFGLNFLKGVNIFKPTNFYYITLNNIDGLTKNAPVYSNGFQVGQVSNIEYNYKHLSPIIVEVILDKQLVVPQGSSLTLYSTDIMGSKGLYFTMTENYDQPHMAGDTLKSGVEKSMLAKIEETITPKIEAVIPQLDSVVVSIRSIIEGEKVQNSLNSIEQITQNIESSSKELKKIMNNDLPVIVSNAKNGVENINKFSEGIKDIELKTTVSDLNASIANLKTTTDKINNKDNSLGLLLNDTSLHDNLNTTIESANSLLIDLQAHPKRYVHFSVFGKKDKTETEKK
jgi:phospholipid/cholesterol/gamma-HCH transport system substrate-binding protein